MPKSDGTLGRNKDFLIFFDKEKMGIYNMQYETHRNTKKTDFGKEWASISPSF